MPRGIVIALVVGLAVAVGWLLSGSAAPDPVGTAPTPTPEAPAATAIEAGAEPTPGQAAAAASRSAASTEPMARARGALHVLVTLAPAGTALPHVGVQVVARDGRTAEATRRGAVTGDDGIAVFADLDAGPWHVRLDRWPEADVDIRADAVTEVALAVPAGSAALVRVVDGNGAAVPGAGVWFWGASGRLDVPVAQSGTMVGTTDAQGELRLLGLPNLRGHGCWVAASHDALGTSAARMVAAPANESDQATRIVELQLGLVGAFLELRVTDTAGSPIAGALAEARPVDQPGSRADAAGRSLAHLLRAGTTGTNGTVRLGPLPPCDYVLQVRAPGCERHGEPFTVGGAQPLQRTVVLEREARVHGRVVSPDGGALPGADVAIQVEPRGGNARSGPDGTFQLGELSPGDATAVASLADHASGATKVKLARGEDAMVTLTLTPLSRCHGRLFDEAGRALAGWGIRIAPRGVSDAVSRAAVTAADGTFSLAAPGDVDHEVSVCEPGRHLPLPLPGATLRPRPEPWDLRVPDAARSTAWIAGTLVDRDDRAAITDQTLAVKGAHFTAWSGNTMEAAVTDPRTGSFRLGPLPPGRYELFLRGRNAVHFSVPDLVLQPHQTTDLGRIVVPASGVVAVELSAEPGLRLADVHMELEGGRSSDVVAIDVGTLRGEQRVLPGNYRVTVYGTGFRWLHQSLDVLPDATATVRGTLRAAVRVGLRVHRPPGERSAAFAVRDSRGEQVFATDLDHDTAHEDQWPFLDRGTFHVEATGASGRRYAARFTVDSLERRREPIDVRVEPVR